MTNFGQWIWGTLLLPIMHLYETKADKKDVEKMSDSVQHISDRVDEIYKHLLEKKEIEDARKLSESR